MTFLRRLFGATRKAVVVESNQSKSIFSMAYYPSGRAVGMGHDYASYASEGYGKSVVAFSCINQLCEAMGSIEWLCYKGIGKKRKELPEHEALKLLLRPNPMMGLQKFMTNWMGFKQIAGEVPVWANRPKKQGPPSELWILRPDLIDVIAGESLPLRYEYRYRQGDKRTYPVDQVTGKSDIHLDKFFNPLNPWRGMSPLSTAALQVDTLNAADKWNLGLVQNGARPSGVLKLKSDDHNKGQLTKTQREMLKKDMEENHSGPENAGLPMVMEGGLEWQQVGLSPVDMDFLNSKKVSKIDVATAFRVPPQLVGIEDSQTYANMEQALLFFWEHTVLPFVRGFRDEMNNWLMPMYGDGAYLDYDEDKISALSPRRESKHKRLMEKSWLTPNEKREADGYQPYEEAEKPADKLYMSSSMVPIEILAADVTEVDPVTDNGDFEEPEKPTEEDDPEESDTNPDDVTEDEAQGAVKHISPEGKARARRVAEWKRQERLRLTFERRMRSALKGYFKAEEAAMVKGMQGVTGRSMAEFVVTRTVDAFSPRLEATLKSVLQPTMEAFGKSVLALGKAAGDHETKAADDRFRSFLNTVLGRVKDRAQEYAAGTRKRILKAMERDLRESTETSVEMDFGESVKGAYVTILKGRVASISRTETHSAAQEASRGAADALRIPNLTKEWIAAQDERTRETHSQADGQKVGLKEKFVVGGVEMDGPGDRNAPAEEFFNCRCATTYSVEE